MSRIAPLSEDLRNKISAGEVVERPASVVKELVENSVDSGATQIEIVVERGGHQLIQVTDDGNGIPKDDIALCFQRYTTSKISTVDDLFQIGTLGFRGEALASIASVSEVSVITSTGNSDEAWTASIVDGKMDDVLPGAGEKGTRISISSLFFNTPARKKFLKSPKVELRHVVDVVQRYALSYPEIRFDLIADGKQLLQLIPAQITDRINDIFDPTYAKKLLPVVIDKGDYHFDGYIGNLDLVRSRPGSQFLFLNRRFIKDRLLNSAIYHGFRSLIKRGEYPFFVLNMYIPHGQVDVNVHPMKTEVRFRDEWRVYHLLKSGVEEALSDIIKTIPSFHPGADLPLSTNQLSFSPPIRPQNSAPHTSNLSAGVSIQHENRSPVQEGSRYNQFEELERAKSYVSGLAARTESSGSISTENIWQVHNKYIIAQIDSGLVIIDQHVAHERILYEEAMTALEDKPLPSQTLLFPEIITFSVEDFSVLVDVIPYLEKIGFRMKEGGKNTVRIEAVPTEIGWGSEKQVMLDIIDHYISHQKEYSSFQENLSASYACHAAVKAGDPLTIEEMQALVNRLFATKHPYYCPHGRPIIVQMSLDELDERFER